MKRSYLENLYFKKLDDHSLRTHRKQENYCSRPYHIKKKGKTLFSSLIPAFVSDDKLFCKRPLSSNKGNKVANVKLSKR